MFSLGQFFLDFDSGLFGSFCFSTHDFPFLVEGKTGEFRRNLIISSCYPFDFLFLLLNGDTNLFKFRLLIFVHFSSLFFKLFSKILVYTILLFNLFLSNLNFLSRTTKSLHISSSLTFVPNAITSAIRTIIEWIQITKVICFGYNITICFLVAFFF